MVGNRLRARPVLFHQLQLFTAKKQISESLRRHRSKPRRRRPAHVQRHQDMKGQTLRACVKASIPRGVAWRAKYEPSKLLRPCKLTTGRVCESNCCFSCCVTGKQNSSAWIVCQTGPPSAQMCERVFGSL